MARIEKRKDLSVPPGFVSRTSFILRKVANSDDEHGGKEGADSGKSVHERPWILRMETDAAKQDSDSAQSAVMVTLLGLGSLIFFYPFCLSGLSF